MFVAYLLSKIDCFLTRTRSELFNEENHNFLRAESNFLVVMINVIEKIQSTGGAAFRLVLPPLKG